MKKRIKRYLPYISFVVPTLITLIVILIFDITTGWNGQKTITYVFSAFIIVCGTSTYQPISAFVYSNDKRMVKSNNELFRAFERIDKASLLPNYKELKDRQSRDCVLEDINRFIADRYPKFQLLSHDNIDAFFNKKKYMKRPLSFGLDDSVELVMKHNKYLELYSKEFEKDYADYKTTEMIKRHPFPFFNTLLPFLVSAIGLFTSLYQEISFGEELVSPLMTYIIIIIETTLIGIVESLALVNGSIPARVNKNNESILEINRLMDDKGKRTMVSKKSKP